MGKRDKRTRKALRKFRRFDERQADQLRIEQRRRQRRANDSRDPLAVHSTRARRRREGLGTRCFGTINGTEPDHCRGDNRHPQEGR